MAFTVAFTKVYSIGDRKEVNGTLVPDNSWTAAGESLTATELGCALELNRVIVDNTGGYTFQYDKANAKLLAYRQKDPADAGGADIPLPAVANSVDLSGQTIPFTAIGKGSAAA